MSSAALVMPFTFEHCVLAMKEQQESFTSTATTTLTLHSESSVLPVRLLDVTDSPSCLDAR